MASMSVSKWEPLFPDICCLFIYSECNKCLITKSQDYNGWWMPLLKVERNGSWENAASKLLEMTLKSYPQQSVKPRLVALKRLLLPLKNVTSVVTFFVTIPEPIVELENQNSKWVDEHELLKMTASYCDGLLGPEPVQNLKKLQSDTPLEFSIVEESAEQQLSVDGIAFGVAEDAIRALIGSAGYGPRERDLLYAAFMTMVFPSSFMNRSTFLQMFSHPCWHPRPRIDSLFRAFDHRNDHFLSFRDMVTGLAASEHCTEHGGCQAEIRCRYIFRYYDVDDNGKLEFDDFKQLIKDMGCLKGTPDIDNEAVLLTKAEEGYKIFSKSPGESLNLMEFLVGVGRLRFRGTSVLFRLRNALECFLQSSPLNRSSDKNNDDLQHQHKKLKFDTCTSSNTAYTLWIASLEEHHATSKAMASTNGGCLTGSDETQYELATHAVKVKHSGVLADVSSLWDLEGTPAVEAKVRFSDRLRCERKLSIESFNQHSFPNELLQALQYFWMEVRSSSDCIDENTLHSIPKPHLSWGALNLTHFGKSLIKVCKHAGEIMSQETRLLELNSPTYILGDLHGNFKDLMSFEETFWRLGPVLTPANLLFLGDYVDRGEYGIEESNFLHLCSLDPSPILGSEFDNSMTSLLGGDLPVFSKNFCPKQGFLVAREP